MAVQLIDPAGLPQIPVYRHVAVATGSKTVYVAGQVSWDAEGTTVGEGDLAAQVEQSYLNAATALAAAGADFSHAVRLTAYVANWIPDQMPLFLEGVERASARLGITVQAPAALIGVAALDIPEHLVEIEVTAVLD
ncbi:RidA family protein [Kineosporia succinea]|uniref:Enamine deaminase RidA (YjgF/YER057c/UK114 family) n=1 Tax=Kineosporia succinea TaxID=84632 RepID=A0ABT9PBC3_9ACTN|nr:RidA family protein [Kineosporia succinea]MDP9829694.1 enamine deaminase RidA (YjgF/YER057c/UK114 family) [Kineosporia succinea]